MKNVHFFFSLSPCTALWEHFGRFGCNEREEKMKKKINRHPWTEHTLPRVKRFLFAKHCLLIQLFLSCSHFLFAFHYKWHIALSNPPTHRKAHHLSQWKIVHFAPHFKFRHITIFFQENVCKRKIATKTFLLMFRGIKMIRFLFFFLILGTVILNQLLIWK